LASALKLAERPDKTIYRDGNKTIKLFDTNYSKSDILNEALNHVRVEEAGLSVPHFQEITSINGKLAIVYDYIDGDTLSALVQRYPEKYDEYLKLFVDMQLKIHAYRSPLLTKLKDKMYRKISICPLDATVRYDLHTRLESMHVNKKLLHGDYCFSNVLIAKDGTMYVIDWSHATQGNASADAARTYLVMRLQNDPEGAEAYLHQFCRRSATPRQYVQRWLPIVAASQSVKGNSEEWEILQEWASVVDYQ
jgi:tRNA A-37 threonylcarbamoyl transferase component Bud32